MPQTPRPIFLNPMKLKMPVGALTSIGHRITGIFLVATVPVSVYLLDLSLRSEPAFAEVNAVFEHLAVKGVVVLLIWTLSHHLLAGLRHLLMDFNLGSTLHTARRSAWYVNLGAIAVALLAAEVLL